MPHSTRTDIAMAVALLWNSGVPGSQISARYHQCSNWYRYQLDLARKLGVEVKEYKAAGGPLTPDERKAVLQRLANGETVAAIASSIRRGKERVRACRDELLKLEAHYRAQPEADIAKDEIFTHRRVAIRFGHNGLPISMPYLRCLDPEAVRA